MKEFVRKLLVSLKRKPDIIPLVAFGLAFVVYSLNLTQISNTTAKIQGTGMGLCGFVTMLFSMLSLVCFGNAYPHRKPINRPMWILMFVMVAIVIFADVTYGNAISAALNRADNPITITSSTQYIANAASLLRTHIVMLLIGCGLTVTLPVYSKWIRKIKTSVAVEDNGSMGNIDIAGED